MIGGSDMAILNKIITSMYIYNSTLFTAELGGMIEAIPVPDTWPRYNNKAESYSLTIGTDKIVLEMQGYRGVLFVATAEGLFAYNLKNANKSILFFEKNIMQCKSIKMDYLNKWLFIVSETRGITVLNVLNPLLPKFIKDIKLPFIQNIDNENIGKYMITDFDVVNGVAFLAVRNKGIVRIDYSEGRFGEPEIFKIMDKINLNDPLDVRFCAENQYLYIIDSERGFIILDTKDNRVIFEHSLVDEGTPERLLLYRRDAIIQTARGLFLFKFFSKKINRMLDFKVGALAKYYNHIIFSKNSSTNILSLGGKANYFNDEDESQLRGFESIYTYDVKLNKFN